MSSINGSGGPKTISVAPGDNIAIKDFGAFGIGGTPADPSELDTLSFTGAGMTAASMILTQVGSDVVIGFEGMPGTRVALLGTTIAELDNLADRGNFLFFGESSVTDAFDTWSPTQGNGTVSHDNATTYLNDLANMGYGKDGSDDVIHGLGGDDKLWGRSGHDSLYGDDGNDQLDGGSGGDRMVGGLGNDNYVVDDVGDQVIETRTAAQGGGIDRVFASIDYTLGANVENLTLTGTAYAGIGNNLDNVITGNAGSNKLDGLAGSDTLAGGDGDDILNGGDANDTLNGGEGSDTLNGGAGADKMVGGNGDDIYYVDNAGDQVIEPNSGGGYDTVYSAIDYTLGATIENLTLTHHALNGTGNNGANQIYGNAYDNTLSGLSGADNLNGDAGNDTLNGGTGNDVMDGGTGNDTMIGGTGDDWYVVDSKGDQVIETLTAAQGGGNDLVMSRISYTLGANLENLWLIGDGNINGTGNALDNQILGDFGINTIKGGGGNDDLWGDNGDTLLGQEGNDRLFITDGGVLKLGDGGAGIDTVNLDSLHGDIDLSGSIATELKNIEILDLHSMGPNGAQNLIVAPDLAIAAGSSLGDHTMLVRGDTKDAVTLLAGWQEVGGADNPFGQAGTYREFVSATAKLYVETGVTVHIPTTPVPDISKLDGGDGFRLDTPTIGSASAGDVNGDGYDDVIVSALGSQGKTLAYVVYGHSGDFDPATTLTSAGGPGYSAITTLNNPINNGGWSVASAGDVNGDGYADVVVSNPISNGPAGSNVFGNGAAYVLFGSAAGLPGTFDISAINGNNGFQIGGAATGNAFGWSVASAGDMNGDGYDDVVVGSPNHGAYVVFGHAGGFAASITGNDLNGSNGFALAGGTAGDAVGHSVASAGDINGDGYDDLIIGAKGSSPGLSVNGETFVVFGHAGPFNASFNLDTMQSFQGFKIAPISVGDGTGMVTPAQTNVSSAGDLNGDGYDDLIIGVYAADPSGMKNAGSTYIVYGQQNFFFPPSIDNAPNTTRIDGVAAGDGNGWSVARAGDVNGDGYDDIIVSSHLPAPVVGNPPNPGEAYVIYGHGGAIDTHINLSTLTANQGFKIDGHGSTGFAWSVASAGDVNGDGYADLTISDYTKNSTYVIFGGNFSGSVMHLGSAGDDTLQGSAAAETFVGGTGNDTMIGGGGKDSFEGGAGNDLIVVSGPDVQRVDGGSGIDTVQLDAMGGVIDLSVYQRAEPQLVAAFTNIERIDLRGGHDNVLELDPASVLAMLGSNGDATADHTLVVRRDLGDAVQLGGGWDTGVVVQDPDGETGSFTKYTCTYPAGVTATLLIENVVPDHSGHPNLATLDGTDGFRLDGANNGEGWSVAFAGDINGDGYADVIVGAPGLATHGFATGGAYVVFGHSGSSAPAIDLSALNGSHGFRIDGVASIDNAGFAVTGAGDVNGDGFQDFMIGAAWTPGGAGNGTAYVVFGHAGGWSATLDLGTLDGTNGIALNGGSSDNAGLAVSMAGDINGDGFADMIVGSPYASPGGQNAEGVTYVVFGHGGAWDASLDLPSLDGSNGFAVTGPVANVLAGASVSSAGDVNGDGIDDLLVGSPNSYPNGFDSGAVYVVFGHTGPWTPSLNLSTLDGVDGFQVAGFPDAGHAGRSATLLGDINGDGYDDILVGAPNSSFSSGPYSGSAYVVFGHGGAWDPTFDLSFFDPSAGFHIRAENPFSSTGNAVASIGDFNGDGYGDFIVGASAASPNGTNSGTSYVVYGHAGPWTELDLSTLDGTNGFRLDGADEKDTSGFSVSGAGDVNGDGFADLIVSSLNSDRTSSYVVYGGDFSGAVTHLGTASAETFNGNAGAENFVTGGGNDKIFGNGGADSISAGAGFDDIHVTDNTFRHIDGGSGGDVLHLDYAGAIDFGDLDGNPATSDRGKISNVETISVDNGQANQLTLHLADVIDLDVTDTKVGGNPALNDVLKITGNAGDTLHLSTSDGWSAADTSSLAGYAIYSHDAVKVAVDTDIHVTVS